MRIEIICTGDEVLTGKTVNTNFAHMSQALEDVGLSVQWGTTVGDDRETLLAAHATNGYVDPADRARWQERVEREGAICDAAIRWQRYDGTSIWLRETVRVVRDAAGQVLYYEGSLEDTDSQPTTIATAVMSDPREGELARANVAALRRRLATDSVTVAPGAELLASVGGVGQVEIAWSIGWCVLGLLLVEPWFAWRVGRQR